jgi:hypothetical protein
MVKYKIKIWTRNSHIGEQKRVIGDHKMTYEVIQDNGCNSYSLEKIPAYALVIQVILIYFNFIGIYYIHFLRSFCITLTVISAQFSFFYCKI